MKLYFLLGLFLFLFTISSINAVDITDCQEIDTSGNYRLIQNITTNTSYCNSEIACIYVNSSDVTLNMNGYSLIDDGGCYYGIDVLQRDGEPTIVFNNVNVYNGNILGFSNSGIRTNGLNNSYFRYLKIINYGSGNGIYLNQPFNQNLDISNNFIETGTESIHGSGYYTNNIHDNVFLSLYGIYLNGYGFNVINNLFGYYSITDYTTTTPSNWFVRNFVHKNSSVECVLEYYPLNRGVLCDFCINSNIYGNYFMTDDGINLINDAHNVNIRQNQYFSSSTFYSTVTFDNTTYNNTFCSNSVTTFSFSEFDVTNLICSWRGNTENATIFVIDQSNYNIVTDICSDNCIPQYVCIKTYKAHHNSTCDIDELYECSKGCINGVCFGTEIKIELPITTTTINPVYNGSYTDSIINTTDLQEAGLSWMGIFFTPMFWIIMIQMIISSIIAWISKNPVTFPIMIFVLSAIFGVFGLYGVYSLYVTIIICLISGVMGAVMFKNSAHG